MTLSTVDLTIKDIQELGSQIALRCINIPDGQIWVGDLSPDDSYDRLRSIYPEVPTTAMLGAAEFARLYRDAAREGQLLSLHISSGLSETVGVLARWG